jgi:hypothetical protein
VPLVLLWDWIRMRNAPFECTYIDNNYYNIIIVVSPIYTRTKYDRDFRCLGDRPRAGNPEILFYHNLYYTPQIFGQLIYILLCLCVHVPCTRSVYDIVRFRLQIRSRYFFFVVKHCVYIPL